eukprot:6488732-Amphidinium_carterae.2
MILQSDSEPSIIELLKEVMRGERERDTTSTMSTSSTSFTSIRRSSGECHQTLFAQSRTTKLQFCEDHNIDNRSFSSHSSLLNHYDTSQCLVTEQIPMTCRWKDFIRMELEESLYAAYTGIRAEA